LSLRGNAGLLPLGAHTLAAMSAGVIVAILISGFFTGMLARLAVPGPDPMPLWLTISIGLTGSIAGAVVAKALFSDNGYVVSFGSLGVAIALVLAYRRFVQHRPIWGPDAYRFPERGFGVPQYRERLHRAGIDPDSITSPFTPQQALHDQQQQAQPGHAAAHDAEDPTENPAHYLGLLEELHDSGVLDESEYEAARTRLLERLRA
jgi:uncharacterized membrane protein YeaQ/YmgE (transglycosylase-associated protein family)